MEINQELINELIKESRRAQQKLYDMFFERMMRLSRIYLINEDDAKSAVLEAFLVVYQEIKNFKGKSSFSTWFNSIVVKRAIELFNKNKKITERELELDPMMWNENFDEADGNMDLYKRYSGDDILKLTHTLSETQRIVFTLYVMEDYTHKEIALELGFDETTSRSHYSHAKKKLQEKLKSLDITSTNHAKR